MKFIKNFFSNAKEGLIVLFYALKDKRTPFYAKFITIAAMAYLVFPIDLIPDALLPIGFLDDLAIVPAFFYFVYKILPEDVITEAQNKAHKTNKKINKSIILLFIAAGAAVLLFLLALYFLYKLIFN